MTPLTPFSSTHPPALPHPFPFTKSLYRGSVIPNSSSQQTETEEVEDEELWTLSWDFFFFFHIIAFDQWDLTLSTNVSVVSQSHYAPPLRGSDRPTHGISARSWKRWYDCTHVPTINEVLGLLACKVWIIIDFYVLTVLNRTAEGCCCSFTLHWWWWVTCAQRSLDVHGHWQFIATCIGLSLSWIFSK